MKLLILQFVIVLCLWTGCSKERVKLPYTTQTARAKIADSLPSGWQLLPLELNTNVWPNAYFICSNTQAFVLVNTSRTNQFTWSDGQGAAHHESLGNECIYVWIVPDDFKPAFENNIYLYFNGPNEPNRLYSSHSVKIYTLVSNYYLDRHEVDSIVKNAMKVTSSTMQFSWTNWQADITASLDKNN